MEIKYYLDGEFVNPQDAKVSLFDLGLLRGYGVFDYVQLYKGQPFHLMDHLRRLKWSAEHVQLELPMSLDELYALSIETIKRNPPVDAGLRFLLTGGQTHGELLLPDGKSNLIIFFLPYTPFSQRCYTEGLRYISNTMTRFWPTVKSTNYYPAIYGMRKAKAHGFDDAMYINSKGEILEGTTSNAFFFKNETLITADQEVVEGVTRQIMLELAQGKFPIEFRSLHMSELEECDEAFLTSSVKDGVPLVQIDDKKVGSGRPGPRTEYMRNLFRNYVAEYLANNPIEMVKN